MAKTVLVIGFGAMGCRHVQSLLSAGGKYEICVVEPSLENRQVNCERIGADPKAIIWYNRVQDAAFVPDLAIVATSSAPRYEIVKFLLTSGVRFLLLEKIVFQSKQQFDEIIDLLIQTGAKAYCNFVNRYFAAYNFLKEEFRGSAEIKMLVHGGEFGLGCNAIHYIDIFQYLTQPTTDLHLSNYDLILSDNENRRGKAYFEFTGSLKFSCGAKNELVLISEKGFSGGVTINIETQKASYLLSEQTQKMFGVGENGITRTDFIIIPTSKLTATIVEEIFSNTCRLTKVEDTANAHALLFNCINEVLYTRSKSEQLCPIT